MVLECVSCVHGRAHWQPSQPSPTKLGVEEAFESTPASSRPAASRAGGRDGAAAGAARPDYCPPAAVAPPVSPNTVAQEGA
eukprot:5936179-Prymnesium_polylepis.2